MMSDIENEILEELFFVISYNELLEEVGCAERDLEQGLLSLIQREWVKAFSEIDGEPLEIAYIEDHMKTLYFLASKQGMLALHGH
ncbi:hypothetical protein [Persicobacter psychrovividus]|uniref:MarR family transcriptional regulator n=1 Tax=Persicobacter psychrovividus TaxID=387638 RepID=A0ABN6L8U8_9BACT|nr:hypothetical protein PEPS_19210 [Persicobacter psychrovividus]